MANTNEREHSTTTTNCTCGHNYAMNQRNDDLLQEGGDHQHESTSSDQQNEQGISSTTIGTSFPLDTSFVQIPMMHTIPTNNYTQHGIRNQFSHHIIRNDTRGTDDNDKSFTAEQRCCSSNNLSYTDYATQLFQAISSTTDSIPSLCQSCVQRYGIFI
jgi:hypothetical protein